MNNTKCAVVFTDKRSPEYYFYHHWTYKLKKYFPNFEFTYFALSTINSAIEMDKFTVWFKTDQKTLSYGVTKFCEPDILIIVGNDYPFEVLFGRAKRRVLIKTGGKHSEKYSNSFDLVITQKEEDNKHYKNAVTQLVVDTDYYKDFGYRKMFRDFFPQSEVSRLTSHFASEFSFNVNLNMPINLTSEMKRFFFNVSSMTTLLEKTDIIDLSLSSMSCNTPVATPHADTTPLDYLMEFEGLVEYPFIVPESVNLREEYILPNFKISNMVKCLKQVL